MINKFKVIQPFTYNGKYRKEGDVLELNEYEATRYDSKIMPVTRNKGRVKKRTK